MITASHNPPRYNGIKLKAAFGGGASNADTRRVEIKIAANMAAGREPLRMELADAISQGLAERFDPFPAYREHVLKLVDFERCQAGQAARGGRRDVRLGPRLSARLCWPTRGPRWWRSGAR